MGQDQTKAYYSEFQFDDGGMKALAGALCWVGLVYFVGASLKPEDVPSVAALARDLLTLPTFCKSAASDDASSMIARIIRQNVQAKKLAVSSYEWAMILDKMNKDSKTKMTVAQAIEQYNSHPEVSAHGGSSAKDCWVGRWSGCM